MVSKEYYIGMDVHKEFVQMAVFECTAYAELAVFKAS